MSWNQLLVIRILLLVARLVADEETKADLRNLSNHISLNEQRLREVA